MGKVYTHFQTKKAQKPYPLGLHIPIWLKQGSNPWAISALYLLTQRQTQNNFEFSLHTTSSSCYSSKTVYSPLQVLSNPKSVGVICALVPQVHEWESLGIIRVWKPGFHWRISISTCVSKWKLGRHKHRPVASTKWLGGLREWLTLTPPLSPLRSLG